MKCALTYYTIIPMPSQFGRGKDTLIYGIVYASHVLNVVSAYTTRADGYSSSMSIFFDNCFTCCAGKEQGVLDVKYFRCESAEYIRPSWSAKETKASPSYRTYH